MIEVEDPEVEALTAQIKEKMTEVRTLEERLAVARNRTVADEASTIVAAMHEELQTAGYTRRYMDLCRQLMKVNEKVLLNSGFYL